MFHRGGYGRGQGRGSGLRGGRAGLTGHVGKRWRLPARGAGMAWVAGMAWAGRHGLGGKRGLAWNQICDSLDREVPAQVNSD